MLDIVQSHIRKALLLSSLKQTARKYEKLKIYWIACHKIVENFHERLHVPKNLVGANAYKYHLQSLDVVN